MFDIDYTALKLFTECFSKTNKCFNRFSERSSMTSLAHQLVHVDLVVQLWVFYKETAVTVAGCCDWCAGGESSSCSNQCRHHGDWLSAWQVVGGSHHDPRASHRRLACRSLWWAIINLLDIVLSFEIFTIVKDTNLIRITNTSKLTAWMITNIQRRIYLGIIVGCC